MRRKSPRRKALYKRPTYLGIVGRIASNLRRLRAAKGWSQAELAFAADDMEVVGLQGIERGSANVTAVTVARLCDALGVDVLELLAPADPPPKRPRGRPPKQASPAIPPTPGRPAKRRRG